MSYHVHLDVVICDTKPITLSEWVVLFGRRFAAYQEMLPHVSISACIRRMDKQSANNVSIEFLWY